MAIMLRYRRSSFLQEVECGSVDDAVGRARAMRDAGEAFDFALFEDGYAVAGHFDIRMSLSFRTP